MGGSFHKWVPVSTSSSRMASPGFKEQSRSNRHRFGLKKGDDGNRTNPTWLPNRWTPVSRLERSMYRNQMRYQNLKPRFFPRYEKGCGQQLLEFESNTSINETSMSRWVHKFLGSKGRWQEGILHNVEITFLEPYFDSFGTHHKTT